MKLYNASWQCFAPQVAARGVPVAEFNMEHTPATEEFGFHFQGPCGDTLPTAISQKYSLFVIFFCEHQEIKNIFEEFNSHPDNMALSILPYSNAGSENLTSSMGPKLKSQNCVDVNYKKNLV